ncbi:MAG: tripartite tricarboxylate transporter permease, partial [Gammaproteobacteria bacterium]
AAFAGRGQVLTAIGSTLVGVMLSTVGTDRASGVERFTFGHLDLVDGIGFVLLAMATFALAEALVLLLSPGHESSARVPRGVWRLPMTEVRELAPVVARSSVLGFFIGVLPGAGATIASFLAYGFERNLASVRDRIRFGQGSLRGLAAPEAANNAACTGSFVPLLNLGIPGSGTTAVLLGVMLAYGIQPGPRLLETEPAVFWGVILSMYVGNIVLLILNLPLIPYLAKLLDLPRTALVPLVLFLGMTGVYLVSFNVFDVYLMTLFTLAAFTLRWLDFPMAPMLLGFILGGMLEENLRRALLVAGDSYAFLWERPITLTLLIITALLLSIPALRQILGRLRHAPKV